MKKSVQGDDWPPLAPPPRPGFRYHLASIAMPFLGLGVTIGLLFLTPDFAGLNHWPDLTKQDLWRSTLAISPLGIAGVVGLFAAGKSMARKEEPGFLAALGVLLNVPPMLLSLMSVAERLID